MSVSGTLQRRRVKRHQRNRSRQQQTSNVEKKPSPSRDYFFGLDLDDSRLQMSKKKAQSFIIYTVGVIV